MPDFISLLYNPKTTLEEIVAQSQFSTWHHGVEVVTEGDYLVLGVSIACRYDLQLLDILDNEIGSGNIKHARVSVFDWTDLRPTVLEPEIVLQETPHHSPLACLWIDGRLAEVRWGFAGRELIADRYRLPLSEILKRPNLPPQT